LGGCCSTGLGLAACTRVKKAIGNRQQALGGGREIAALRWRDRRKSAWVKRTDTDEHGRTRTNTDEHGQTRAVAELVNKGYRWEFSPS
jgi:hypothetical protein